jgi:hypothetical protein
MQKLPEEVIWIDLLNPTDDEKAFVDRGAAVGQKQASRAAIALGDAPIASRYADYRQKPRLGSRGEDFPLVNRLSALPAGAQ